METAGARRNKALVKFMEAAGEKRSQHAQRGPAEVPSLRRREGSAPGEECQRAQEPIAAEVSGLPDQEMDVLKLMMGNWPVEEVDEPEQNASCMLGGKSIGGERCQHA